MPKVSEARSQREQAFWDHAVPTVSEALQQIECGPDPHTALMIDTALGAGSQILDFACGVGVTAIWLAQQGAEVTAVDLSPKSIDVAVKVAKHLGAKVDYRVADIETTSVGDQFDAIIGRYALHHLDIPHFAPLLAGLVRSGGVGAFVETMDINPLLRLARRHLVGRFGIPRYGSLDEHPLTSGDLLALGDAFGSIHLETLDYRFLSILNRQIFKYKYPRLARLFDIGDQRLFSFPLTRNWSYYQTVILRRPDQ